MCRPLLSLRRSHLASYMVWMRLWRLFVFHLIFSSSSALHSLLTSCGRYLIVAASFVLRRWKGSSVNVFLHHKAVGSFWIIIIIINKVLIKVMLNKVIAGALYIVCGWNAVKAQNWNLHIAIFDSLREHVFYIFFAFLQCIVNDN